MTTSIQSRSVPSPLPRRERPLIAGQLLWAWAAVALCCGCGTAAPPTGDVQGTVSFGGSPVTGANVVFENTERGWLRAAELDDAGSYSMNGVKTAAYKVSIHPPTPQTPNENTHPDGKFVITTEMIPDPKNIPKPYREAHTSSLSVSVEPGPNQFDFELSNDAP